MPNTRHQAAISEGKETSQDKGESTLAASRRPQPQKKESAEKSAGGDGKGKKRDVQAADAEDEPPVKKARTEGKTEKKDVYQAGTIERGHVFFFYRPRVGVDEVHSLEEIRHFHMLLIPRPPGFAAALSTDEGKKVEVTEANEMEVLKEGADAVPASDTNKSTEKHYRLVTVGKKMLPNPDRPTARGRKKEAFWATVTAVGEDLQELTNAFEGKTYETKTRGIRHEGPVRVIARGGYAIVNSEARTPSRRETHFGYHISHPSEADLGDVQTSLGIVSASSFVLQVKNPSAPANTPQQAHSKSAEYPEWIMRDIFGQSDRATGRRQSYGLRFVSCATPELLDYKGAELLLIAARQGEQGLETSLGEGRGRALSEKEEEEARIALQDVFQEIGLDLEKFPAESLQGNWV